MSSKKKRHPTEKKVSKSALSLPIVSCGRKEFSILTHINSSSERFNVKRYSIINNISRSTLYSILKRLTIKGLIYKPHAADHKITKKGKCLILAETGGVDNSRKECRRGSAVISTHKQKFSLPISDRSAFRESELAVFLPCKTHKVELSNLTIHYIYLDEITIIIKPKVVLIYIHEILSEELDESQLISFKKITDILPKLTQIGIITERILLSEAHFARLETTLADFLEKVDGKYLLNLGDGNQFWIDRSLGPIEDETNNPESRERLDQFMRSVFDSESLVTDLDKIKDILSMMIKLRLSELTVPNNLLTNHDKKLADYFG